MSFRVLSALAACLSATPFKRSLGAVSHALIACSLLSACDNGSGPAKEDPKSLLVGKVWAGKTHTLAPGMELGNGQAPLTDWFEISPACAHDDTWRFEANGRYTVDGGASLCDFEAAMGPVDEGRWTLNAEGTTLTLMGEFAMEAEVWTVQELSKDRFRASFPYPMRLSGKDQTETVTFTVR